MQGKKYYQPRLFNSFNLAERIPENNFYRQLKEILDLRFLFKETEGYYGKCGQKSLDPTVFFRLCLVGYLENIISDRQLIQHASMRLDIIYFIDYDIEDELPWHSTLAEPEIYFLITYLKNSSKRYFPCVSAKGWYWEKVRPSILLL
jgi:hypothetical protein